MNQAELMKATLGQDAGADILALLAKPKKVVARFYMDTKQDEAASLREGRAVCEDVEMVQINWIGDGKREFHANAHERSSHYEIMPDRSKRFLSWAEAFRPEYDQFRKGVEQVGEGTPLAEMTAITPARRQELQSLNIYTVEALANLGQLEMRRLKLVGQQLQTAAKEWLLKREGESTERLLREELQSRDAQMLDMQRQLEELQASLTDERTKPVNPNASDREAESKESAEVRQFFESMEDEDLRNWIRDGSGTPPKHNCTRETLIKKCLEMDAEAREAAA